MVRLLVIFPSCPLGFRREKVKSQIIIHVCQIPIAIGVVQQPYLWSFVIMFYDPSSFILVAIDIWLVCTERRLQ